MIACNPVTLDHVWRWCWGEDLRKLSGNWV